MSYPPKIRMVRCSDRREYTEEELNRLYTIYYASFVKKQIYLESKLEESFKAMNFVDEKFYERVLNRVYDDHTSEKEWRAEISKFGFDEDINSDIENWKLERFIYEVEVEDRSLYFHRCCMHSCKHSNKCCTHRCRPLTLHQRELKDKREEVSNER